MWEPFLSYSDLSFLQRGDWVKITFTPHSQKHFDDPNYEFYFPTYEGKVISSVAKTMDELLIRDSNGKTLYCINRAGTSGFPNAYYTRYREISPNYNTFPPPPKKPYLGCS